MHSVVFMPSGARVSVPPGTSLLDACRRAGYPLPTPCGGRGLCGKCRVKMLEGDVPADDRQQSCLTRALLAEGWRAACIASVQSDLVLEQPDANAGEVILTGYSAREARGVSNNDAHAVGLAVDIGTTTVVAALCSLATGSVLSVTARANPQSVHGDDVTSRLEYASRGERETTEMQRLIVLALQELASELCGGNTPQCMAVGCNTVMRRLLVGPSPETLFPASDIGWKGANAPLVYVVPGIAPYVGGDITAGILAHDIHREKRTVLFLDIGTNGEIVLSRHGKLYTCAAAAGPAFEGARITQGMRAMAGAIDRVTFENNTLNIGVVDKVKPARGICGTGILDAVAAFLQSGLADSTGRLLDGNEVRKAANRVSPKLISLVHADDDGQAVWLERPSGRGGAGVSVTQRDIREFQLAKGAIAAGVAVLLDTAGVRPDRIDEVVLAGGFGTYLNPRSAIRVGLLPAGIGAEKVRSVGNASLAGTMVCLLSEQERQEAETIVAMSTYVELSGRDDFQRAFVEHMAFP